MNWWVRPSLRVASALLLPFIVPAVIIGALWALPGDPALNLCSPPSCNPEKLAEHWGLDQGPFVFYQEWFASAIQLDFGKSWQVLQGFSVTELLKESFPVTAGLMALSLVPLLAASFAAAMGVMPRRLDIGWQGLGLIPAVILALFFDAWLRITYGEQDLTGTRMAFGAVVLGLADGTLSGAIVGTRSVLEEEVKQRYVQIAVMRGETVVSNTLPNVLPSLVGQFRARLLTILSGAVIVEVVLGLPGLGSLLWDGTLSQDFGVVLAATFAFSILSGFALLVQGAIEVGVSMYTRRSPDVALPVSAEV